MLEDAESEMYWMQFSDFYDWPHIQYFDDYKHLKQIILYANLTLIRSLMGEELQLRKKQVVKKWCNVIHRVAAHNEINKI